MARVTVEDCLSDNDNRFDLVLMAAKRARKLAFGSNEPMLDWENDKVTVMALREIAAGYRFTDGECEREVQEVQEVQDSQGAQDGEVIPGFFT